MLECCKNKHRNTKLSLVFDDKHTYSDPKYTIPTYILLVKTKQQECVNFFGFFYHLCQYDCTVPHPL